VTELRRCGGGYYGTRVAPSLIDMGGGVTA
jgi:hypothetical protein